MHKFLAITLFSLQTPFLSCLEIPDTYVPAHGLLRSIDETVYIAEPQIAKSIYDLPIHSPHGINISQGPINKRKGRSHSYYSCLYAIDFLTSYDKEPGKILAAQTGTVININTACSSIDPIYHCDNCGDGFGNWIGILHEDNEISFYAHLEKMFVQVGQTVQKGEKIGVEGTTGMAGSRHLHFSVHRLPENISPESAFDPPFCYPSIPYALEYTSQESNEPKVVDIRIFRNLDLDRDYLQESKMWPASSSLNTQP